MSLLKNLVVAVALEPLAADKSAVTVTAPVVAELGVKSIYVPSVVFTESTAPPLPLEGVGIQPKLPAVVYCNIWLLAGAALGNFKV